MRLTWLPDPMVPSCKKPLRAKLGRRGPVRWCQTRTQKSKAQGHSSRLQTPSNRARYMQTALQASSWRAGQQSRSSRKKATL